MKWTKEKCPLCEKDGRIWEWNTHGGQSYVKCDHTYPDDVFFDRVYKLKADRKSIDEQLETLNHWRITSIIEEEI